MTMIPATMRAMQLTGHGDFDRLVLGNVAVPRPGSDEVLVKVAASSVNNTDINTRIGWYAYEGESGGGWGGTALSFPRIQGTDIAGQIVDVGSAVERNRIGERVIVQACLVSRAVEGVSPFVGSEIDGGFADYAVVPALDAHAVETRLTDLELGTLPCAYGTAANMLEQAGLVAGDRLLVTGASGNVGIAALLLSRLAGAEVHAVAAPEKWEALRALGAAACYPRDLSGSPTGRDGFSLVVDLVGGDAWAMLLERLKPHGRLVTAGAVSGATATFDLRKLYLNNWTLLGRTEQTRSSFRTLIDHINAGRLVPPIHRIYPLSAMAEAQREFLARKHVGKIAIDVSART